jgi:hypothetical protein
MITVYGPNGETKKINARSVIEWLGNNPGWSLDNPRTGAGIDESKESIKIINQAMAGERGIVGEKSPEEISEDLYMQAENGIYYSGIPSVLPNPNWEEGMPIDEKYAPVQNVFPGIKLIPSYEGDLYLSGPNFNAVNIANMQELLEDAQYLTGSYNPGVNDAATKQAVRAWFGDVNGARLNSYANGGNINIDPMEFLGNQINNRFESELQQIKDYTQEVMQTVDRGKMLRDGVQKLVGNRRDYTNAELDAFRSSMNDLIDQEIKRNEDIAVFKLKQEFGKLPDPQAVAGLGLEGAEGAAFMSQAETLATQPEVFSASEAFIEKYGPEYKSFREYPERQQRAQLNFNNVNRSILGTSMRIG